MFLRPVGYAGHIVHSDASEVQNVDVIFFMLVWSSTGSTKSAPGHVTSNLCFASGRICRSLSTLWLVHGAKLRRFILLARVGPVRIPEKARRDTLCQTCVFASTRICRSRSAFRCVKHQHTNFHAHVGSVQIPEKVRQDTLR
jgi:hypothetical protein